MTEAELRHAVGDRVYDAFAPQGRLYNHDAEDPDDMAFLGTTDQGEEVEINKRAAESDLLVYVNINLVAMDGGWKSTATGLASYRSLRHHHNVRHDAAEPLVHGPAPQRAALVELAHGQGASPTAGVKVFQIETTLNTDTFPKPFDFLQKREWEWTRARPRHVHRRVEVARAHAAARSRRQIFQSLEAPHAHDLACRPARSRPCTTLTPENVLRAAARRRSRARPTSSRWACRTSARTT